MAKWVHSNVLDFGINHIRTTANSQLLISTYTPGDSYGVVMSNMCAEVAMAPTDYTLASSGSNRTLTTASGKTDPSANASSGPSPDLHIAFVDTSLEVVVWVTDETSDQVITAGNPVNFPNALVYTSNQPI